MVPNETGKNPFGFFLILKIWQILKRFARQFHQAFIPESNIIFRPTNILNGSTSFEKNY